MVWLLLGANGVLGDSGPIDLSCEISSASSNSRSTTSESWLDFIHPPTFAEKSLFFKYLPNELTMSYNKRRTKFVILEAIVK